MENKKLPRVLVISHNVFSQTSSMGRTLANFFAGWPSDKLAQIYFHSQVPTMDICNMYYRVTDFDMVKQPGKKTGTIFGEKDVRKDLITEYVDTKFQSKVYGYSKKKKPYMYIVRNLVWSTNKWKNDKLLKWLDEFNPELIFFASGDYVFSYKVAEYIAKYKNIPVVTYVCDDYYYLNKKSISLFYHINRMQYKNVLKDFFTKHKHVVCICEKIAVDYQKEFGITANVVMTSSELKSSEKTDASPRQVTVSYLGNMGYGRHLQLIEIGKTLRKITNGNVFLDIYSGENRQEVISKFTEEKGVRFHGSVAYKEVAEIMRSSDILVHTEAMDKECADKVRYSVSTKVADSLACGKCLLAYGPSDVASIEYLTKNNCACVVTERDNLEEKLAEIINDSGLRDEYSRAAVGVANYNHNFEKNSRKIKEILSNTV